MLKGILPAIPTCFTNDNQIDKEAQKKVIQFVIAAGVHGIVFPGLASEYNYLTSGERIELIELLVSEVDGRLPIVAGIGASSKDESILLGREVMKFGINHFMLMAPKEFEKDTEKHKTFFQEVAAALPGGVIVLQNAPSPSGAGLNADELIEVSKDNSAIKYLKEETLPSGPTITALLNHDMPHLLGVFGGAGSRFIIDELNRGSLGAFPASEIIDLHVAIYNAHQKGEAKQARNLYRMSLPILTAQMIYRMELTKYILKKRGVVDALHVRTPLPKLDAQARLDLDMMLQDLQEENVLM
jgi:dihydrodipicolinate synthase/N-acetylneuraminate lyase